ncbi:MAG: metallophosphoesterase [Bdellovibrionota bacterium]|nr:metallophosphoesterase [Bdellovibrionota bacterium]
MSKLLSVLRALIGFLHALTGQAKLVQILHTNDLHSYLESTIKDPKKGGYATLKGLIDRERMRALKSGIPTLVLDAGDFLEGNLFFLSDGGKQVMKVMNQMGYDAVVLGNHDWLMGTRQMDNYLKEVSPNFPLLAANFSAKDNFTVIQKTLKPQKTFNIDGMKISILGLTTSELFYRWANDQGKISSPIRAGKKWAKRLKKDGSDFVIALTHLGLNIDKELAEKADLDLVVGGHSHTALYKPVFVDKKERRSRSNDKDNDKDEDKEKGNRKLVPIVQAGSHGQYLGRLIVDLKKGRDKEPNTLKVLSYKLLPVLKEKTRPNLKVDTEVKRSRKKLEREFGKEWLFGEIGYSDTSLEISSSHLTPLGAYLVGVMRERVGADVGLDSPAFFGTFLPEGPLSRASLFNIYPRIFGLQDRFGWHIWKAKVKGSVLKNFIKFTMSSKMPILFSGVQFDIVDKDGVTLTPKELIKKLDEINWGKTKYPKTKDFLMFGFDKKFKLKNFKINGEKLERGKYYKVALSEGFAAGSLGTTSAIKLFLKDMEPTPFTMWDTLSEGIERLGFLTPTILKDYAYGLSSDHKGPFLFLPGAGEAE